MKIDEGCINHNAVRVIKSILTDIQKLDDETLKGLDKHSVNLMMLSAISGVIEMTDALKEVLKC